MAITHTYCDYGTGNDYKGATFNDGAFTVADMTLTKAGAFTASKVNHWLYLDDNGSGEVTTGYYRIASVTSANAVVLAVSPKSGATDPVDVVCTQADGTTSLPWRSVQGAFDLITRDSTNGDQVNISDAAVQVLAASLTLTTYGTPAERVPLVLRGYTSAANDGGMAEIDCNGATMWVSDYDYVYLIDLEAHSGGNNGLVHLDDNCAAIRCYFHAGVSSPVSKACLDLNMNATVVGCRIGAYGTGVGQEITLGSNSRALGNYVISHFFGIYVAGGEALDNIVYCPGNTSGIAINTNYHHVRGNAVYAETGNTGSGIYLYTADIRLGSLIENNVLVNFSGVGGKGIALRNNEVLLRGANAFYNCTANYADVHDMHYDLTSLDVALAADPFTDAANGDFSLTEAAKAALRSLGWPASYLGAHANSDPHITIGPMQYGPTPAAGGGMLKAEKRGGKQ